MSMHPSEMIPHLLSDLRHFCNMKKKNELSFSNDILQSSTSAQCSIKVHHHPSSILVLFSGVFTIETVDSCSFVLQLDPCTHSWQLDANWIIAQKHLTRRYKAFDPGATYAGLPTTSKYLKPNERVDIVKRNILPNREPPHVLLVSICSSQQN